MLDKNKLYYLSHPFTSYGDKKENQEKAADIEMRLREKYGIKVINPILLPLNLDLDKAMKQCRHLHDACDETIFCDDWDKSKGCKEEFAWCNDLNRHYYFVEMLLEDEADNDICNSFDYNHVKNNVINHPSHYNQGIECIDYIESHDFNFNLGNAIKYISRCEYKGNKIKDIGKAIWYLKRELEKE